MITDALKDWLASNAGINNCYSSTNVSYTDPDGVPRTGGTGDVLNAFVVAHLVGKDSAEIIANTNYTQLKVTNGNNDLSINDVAFAYNNDGDPSTESQYCTTQSSGGNGENLGDFTFNGLPAINLDITNITMDQNKNDFHFEINGIKLTSESTDKFYAAFEVQLFKGTHTKCPVDGQVFSGLSRISTTKEPRIHLLSPNEVDTFNADFYQPGSINGIYTVCLIVHGDWKRTDLENEIASIKG